MVSDSDNFDEASANGADWLRALLESEALGVPMHHESQSDASWVNQLFADATMTEVMRRLFEGDPLGLQPAVCDAIESGAQLVNPQRLFNIVLARCAFRGLMHGFEGGVNLADWVREQVQESLQQLREEDWAEEAQGLPLDPLDPRYENLLVGTALDPIKARKLSLQFNQMKPEVRRPLFEVLVNRRAVEVVAQEAGLELSELRALIADRLSGFTLGPRSLDELDGEWDHAPGASLDEVQAERDAGMKREITQADLDAPGDQP